MIIDIHSHLGDILYPGGGGLIFKEGLVFPKKVVPDEKMLFYEPFYMKIRNRIFKPLDIRVERKRNFSATLENFQKSLEGLDIKYSVCAPIAPNTTFDDMLKAHNHEGRIIPFASPDFTSPDMVRLLHSDLENGLCKGVKIHPIIQEVEADSQRVMEAVDIISPYELPVLLHTGKSGYYTAKEKKKKFVYNASIDKINKLVATFPKVKFILGHAGLSEVSSVIDMMPMHKNAYVDTSFQPPDVICALVAAFGGDRVLFASDWPYGLRRVSIDVAKMACGDDNALLKALMHDNAARLLNL